eukprot:919412-Pelagomonas_calceolata.AAC.3
MPLIPRKHPACVHNVNQHSAHDKPMRDLQGGAHSNERGNEDVCFGAQKRGGNQHVAARKSGCPDAGTFAAAAAAAATAVAAAADDDDDDGGGYGSCTYGAHWPTATTQF